MLKIINGGIQPTKATQYSAGIDLYANEDVTIWFGETKIIGLGVYIDLKFLLDKFEKEVNFEHKCGVVLVGEAKEEYCRKKNELEKKFETFCKIHYLELHPRSSLRAKGLIAGVGIIDMDYKDEIKIIFNNFSCEPKFEIKKGDKIAQILFKEHKGYLFDIESNEERKGGFGSTDKENK